MLQGFPILSIAQESYQALDQANGRTVKLNQATCRIVTKALNEAKTGGCYIMLQLAAHPGNFICARPDATMFIVDFTQ
jgi:hypothetical protein